MMDLMHPVTDRQTGMAGQPAPRRGTVLVFCPGNAQRGPSDHESATHGEVAKRLAAIKGYDFAGVFDATRSYAGPLYFVPSDTLVTLDAAHRLGIHGEQDLFGGVVPFSFMATKTITHPLAAADSRAPHGWSFDLARRVRDVVLPGFSAFSMQDAREAGARLLEHGAVRIKKASGTGGLGQWVAADAGELEARLRSLDAQELARDGLVLERNLSEVATLSVGQVRVNNLLASYCGVQRLTTNNTGQEVYGGSDLTVVRGDFAPLLELELDHGVRTAIAQARQYHAAVLLSFPGMFASRCNYDVAQGRDAEGRWHSGVLEQSWRIGGASGAEVAALDAFQADPALEVVRASTIEIYGSDPALPDDAEIYFRGIDASVGHIAKYARLEPYADA